MSLLFDFLPQEGGLKKTKIKFFQSFKSFQIPKLAKMKLLEN